MKASAVIPTHDRDTLLASAIYSCIAQDLRPLEILVVDDTESLSTKCVVDRLGDSSPIDIEYIPNPGSGASSSRNLGTQRAKGDYIGYLDDDDVWLPWHLSEANVYQNSANPYAMYAASRAIFDADSGLIEKVREPRLPQHNFDWFTGSPGFSGSNIILRREASVEIPWDENLYAVEDVDLALRFFQSDYGIALSNSVSVATRDHAGPRLRNEALERGDTPWSDFQAKHRPDVPASARAFVESIERGQQAQLGPGFLTRSQPWYRALLMACKAPDCQASEVFGTAAHRLASNYQARFVNLQEAQSAIRNLKTGSLPAR